MVWSTEAWDDYVSWQQLDSRIAKKINDLVKDARRDPFTGIGKPEPLKGELAGWWSRRIDGEHRLVYRITGKGSDQRIEIAQCRDHY